MPPTSWSQDTYSAAYRFAADAHRGQTVTDTDLPYLLHIGLVSMELIAALRVEPGLDETLALGCALLHDVLEDTPTTYAELVAAFGTAVADGVQALSKDVTLPKAERMADSLERIRRQPPEIWMVKLADRITNLQPPPRSWSTPKIAAYRAEAQQILDALGSASPTLAARLQQKIVAYPGS